MADEGKKTSDGNLTRVEVIDQCGRWFVAYNLSDVVLSFQDEGRTLKVFCRSERLRTMSNREFASCTWTEDESGTWHTECGNSFDGKPSQNRMGFCCYCGWTSLKKPYVGERSKDG